MSIYFYCRDCRTSFDIDLKTCPKCSAPIDPKRKYFLVSIMVNKKRIRKIVTGTLTLAREVEAKIKTQMVEGIYKDPRRVEPALNDVWAKYLEGYKARGKAWHREELRYDKTLRVRFGSRKLKDISPFDIEKLMIELKTAETNKHRPYSPKAIKNIIDLLSLLFNYARRVGLYEGNNPCERVTKPKINNEVLNVLPVEKIQEMLKYLETYHHRTTANLIRFLTFTGCRLGEAINLDYADVNFDERIIRLRNPKGGRDQYIYLNVGALRALEEQRHFKRPDNDIVFPADDGQRKRRIGERWDAIKKGCGIPAAFRCHDLRHQFASMLASSGEVDQYTLQRLLTHKDFKTTQRYAHLFPQTVRDGAAMIDKILETQPDNIIKIAK